MSWVFTPDALHQMSRRNIDQKIVRTILRNPEQKYREHPYDIYQSVIHMSGRDYLVRVFVTSSSNPGGVVHTVYRTSNIDR